MVIKTTEARLAALEQAIRDSQYECRKCSRSRCKRARRVISTAARGRDRR